MKTVWNAVPAALSATSLKTSNGITPAEGLGSITAMDSLTKNQVLFACINEELGRTENYLKTVSISPIDLITRATRYSLSSPGKRIRPALVILISKILGYCGPMLVPCAAAVEMAHAATLIHDDVVDHAKLRRGKDSSHNKFGSEVSLLTGDYLFAKAFQIVAKLEDIKLLEMLSEIAINMCEGEIFHLTKKGNIEITEEEYFEVIKRKTANFMLACCEIGCKLGRADEKAHKAFRNYGLYLGMAFQIVDDVLNLVGDEKITGKPRGSDLLEGKYSLSVIRLLKVLKKQEPQTDLENVDRIVSLGKEYGIFEYASQVARRYAENAKAEIAFLDECDGKTALLNLADYVVERSC